MDDNEADVLKAAQRRYGPFTFLAALAVIRFTPNSRPSGSRRIVGVGALVLGSGGLLIGARALGIG